MKRYYDAFERGEFSDSEKYILTNYEKIQVSYNFKDDISVIAKLPQSSAELPKILYNQRVKIEETFSDVKPLSIICNNLNI